MPKMKIGYIARYDLDLNPHLTEKFQFKEATFTRRISSRGDRVYSKMLMYPTDEESGMVYCPGILGHWVNDDWYCGDGERKEEK